MSNSQVNALLYVLDGLFKDACLAYPELEGEFYLDKKRLALNAQTRSLAYFMLDLPNLDSLLLRGLRDGRLSLEGPCSHRVSKRIKVPRLFSGLWLRVFDRSSCLKRVPDTTAIAFLRQFTGLGKKIEVVCSRDRLLATLRSYHDVERSLRNPTLRWDNDRIDIRKLQSLSLTDAVAFSSVGSEPCGMQYLSGIIQDPERQYDPRDEYLLDRVQQVADSVIGAFGFLDPVSYSSKLEEEGKGIGFKHGPGAVAERLRNPEKSGFPWWPAKLQDWFPFNECGKTASVGRPQPPNHEVAARLISVPKTFASPRLIAAEPVAHQWCQQLVWHWLRNEVRNTFGSYRGNGYFIDFRNQGLSGKMVLKASRDRKLCTVDLSDASDRLSCWTVERVFRSNPSILSSLHAARTRYLRDDLSSPGHSLFIKLKKFASQGTATTFPVQSLVFLIIALASCLPENREISMREIRKLRSQVRTYGDDIIMPVYGYARLNRIMELLQLKVNVAKSYVTGSFRESCGVHGYGGDDVTPVRPKTLVADGPSSRQAVVDTTNNLFNKGYWHASYSLYQTLPPRVQRGLRVVGIRDDGFSGLTSFSGSDERHLRKRWNPRLHRNEVRVWGLSPKSDKRDRDGWSPLLDFFASIHSEWNPRITSEFGTVRKVRDDLLWEPSNSGAHGFEIHESSPHYLSK